MDSIEKMNLFEISKELSFKHFTGDDWGIINEDADRTKEFIEYYNNKVHLFDPPTIMIYIELVISSFNAALVEEKVDNELKFLFKEFIYPHLSDEDIGPLSRYFAVSYWTSFINGPEEEDFPVAFMIKEMMGE